MSALTRWVERKALTIQRAVPVEDDDGSVFYRSTGVAGKELADVSFDTFVSQLYKANGIVFACIGARMKPFSEARFQLQELHDGRPGKLFDHPSLRILEEPWPNGTTGELLSRMEQDASLAGNWFGTVVGTGPTARIRRLRPDWVTIVSGVLSDPNAPASDLESEVLAYIYEPPGSDPVVLSADRVAHFSPIPDPQAQWRGMSWLTPLLREVEADQLATTHKLKFFKNGAALSTVISYDKALPPAKFQRFVELFRETHEGPQNAYKTLHIGGGATPTTIGTELKTDFRAIQGAGETRIAAAAGVGAIMARFSEGLQGSALNQGNYAAAKRQFADMELRPSWRTAAAALGRLIPDQPNSRLWYDPRDVEFLKDDRKDAAEILKTTTASISALVTAGFTPDSVIDAVETGDLTRLSHSGRFSVQLLPPDQGGTADPNTPPSPGGAP